MAAASETPSGTPGRVAIATRTLFASGFSITNVQKHPNHIEYEGTRQDPFGQPIQYVFLIFEGAVGAAELEAARQQAAHARRVVVTVSNTGSEDRLSWHDFLDVLGGPVPSWRALSADYRPFLIETAKNRLPAGVQGEAWQLFEHAAADGLEFVTGMRARRLGGHLRGRRVVDILVQTPNREVILVDAKASGKPYDASWPKLRPLLEYVNTQRQAQRGADEVIGALIVADGFEQEPDGLTETSKEFLSEAKVPLSFLRATQLADMVEHLAGEPHLRRAIRWHRILATVGPIADDAVVNELKLVKAQRVDANGFK